MKKVSDFLVLNEMSKRGKDINACFSDNIHSISYDDKRGSKVTIGVSNKVGLDLDDKYIMACYFVDKNEFFELKKELEGEA